MRELRIMEFRRVLPLYEILLISNDLPTILIIKSNFNKKQFKVNIVFSCSQALEELQKLKPWSILLDMSLPEENRKEFLKRIKSDKRLKKVSVKTFSANEFKLQRTAKKESEKIIHEEPPIPPLIKDDHIEFEISQYIMLKLENKRTVIYVNHTRFLNCMRLTLNIQKSNVEMYDEINSIDEAADLQQKYLYKNKIVEGPNARVLRDEIHDITPEQEFWGHCSNIQAWVEHDYDTRLLKSNLSFPLLKKLTEVGDPSARKVFKKEITFRIEDGYPSVVQYLINEGYLNYLTPFEIKTIFETTKLLDDFSFSRKQLYLIKKGLLKLLKQTDLKQRENIEKIISKIDSKITTEVYKVIVVGDFEVGKSELLNKLVNNKFGEPNPLFKLFETQYELDDHKTIVNLMLFSIPSQSPYFKTYRHLFHGADGIVLVFDTTRSSTFSNVNNLMIEIASYGLSDVPRILVGNKIDLKDERKIILPMAEHLSEKLNATYFEASALTGENVKIAFRKLAELINEAKKKEESQDLGEIIFRYHEDNLNQVRKNKKID